MPLDIPPDSSSIEAKAKTDVRRELPALNPFLKNSIASAFIVSFANRIYDFYLQLTEAIRQNFPDTATETFLERWANIWGINRIGAKEASGNIVVTGLLGETVPDAVNLVSSDGNVYATTDAVLIATQSVEAAGTNPITRTGSVATFTAADPHDLSSAVTVTITGADQSEYNVVNSVIQVTSSTQFTYDVSGTPATPATTGTTIDAAADFAPVPVLSAETQDTENGVDLNLVFDTPLTFQTPIVDIDTEATVGGSGITGGSDQEGDEQLRVRLLQTIQNPIAQFNAAAITAKVFETDEVTRVWIREITNDAGVEELGSVTVYFVMDDRTIIIPVPADLTAVKDSIVVDAEGGIKPANTSSDNVYVPQMVAQPIAITIDNLNTTEAAESSASLQDAVTANLEQFFREETEPGATVYHNQLIATIQNTVDPTNGEVVETFDLTVPAGDTAATDVEYIATLTTPITFTFDT